MHKSWFRFAGVFILVLAICPQALAADREAAWEAADLEARNALDRGDLAEARRAAEDAARIAQSAFSTKQMKTAIALRRLSELERLSGDTSRSSATLDRAAEAWQRTLGGKSPYLADLKLRIAHDREAAGDQAGAESAFGEAIQMRRAYFGARHTAVADALQQRAQFELKSGRLAPARRDEAEAADILLGALKPAHPRTLKAFESLALHAVEQENLTLARNDLKRVLASAVTAAQPDLKNLAQTWTLSADYAAQDHDTVAAEEAYSRALELLERAGDEARPERLAVLYKLQELHKASGRTEAASQVEQRALNLEHESAAIQP